MATPPDDPIARAWTVALRAQLDAVVAQFEAQLRQHVAYSNASTARELAGLNARITELDQSLVASRAVQSQQAAELARLLGERERWTLEARQLQDALRAQTAELARLRGELAERDDEAPALAAQVQSLDAQFAWPSGTSWRRCWACRALSSSTRRRRRSARRWRRRPGATGTEGEAHGRGAGGRDARAGAERGAGCADDDERRGAGEGGGGGGLRAGGAGVGQRYSAATMDKAGERAEPADEGLVVACVMPGLRLAGSAGSLVHPRVIVGTA
jgi:hypothetical protein